MNRGALFSRNLLGLTVAAIAIGGGCGPSGSPTATAASAKHAGVSCARLSSAAASADGVLGANLGMSPKAASAVLTCADPNYVVSPSVSGFSHLAIETGARPVEALLVWSNAKGRFQSTTLDQISLEFLGMPGSEKLTRIHRTLVFENGAIPAMADVLAQLKKKYGEPSNDIGNDAVTDLIWAHAADGSKLTAADAIYETCKNYSFGGGINDGCGLTIGVRIFADGPNHAGVQSLETWVVDQNATYGGVQAEDAAILKANAPTGKAPAL